MARLGDLVRDKVEHALATQLTSPEQALYDYDIFPVPVAAPGLKDSVLAFGVFLFGPVPDPNDRCAHKEVLLDPYAPQIAVNRLVMSLVQSCRDEYDRLKAPVASGGAG